MMPGQDSSWSDRTFLQKRNRKLYEEMLRSGALEPGMTVSKVIALVLSLAIHALTLYFIWACLWNIVNAIEWLSLGSPIKGAGGFVVALGSFAAVWILRPRLGRWPAA